MCAGAHKPRLFGGGKHLYSIENTLNGIRPISSTDVEPAQPPKGEQLMVLCRASDLPPRIGWLVDLHLGSDSLLRKQLRVAYCRQYGLKRRERLSGPKLAAGHQSEKYDPVLPLWQSNLRQETAGRW